MSTVSDILDGLSKENKPVDWNGEHASSPFSGMPENIDPRACFVHRSWKSDIAQRVLPVFLESGYGHLAVGPNLLGTVGQVQRRARRVERSILKVL